MTAPPAPANRAPLPISVLAAVLAGAAALVLGVAVYTVVRPGGWGLPVEFWGSAPTLLHSFAFTLWTLVALQGGRTPRWAVVLGWAALQALIEAFQHPALHATLPSAAALHWAGTFDPFDCLAAAAGASLAGLYTTHLPDPRGIPV